LFRRARFTPASCGSNTLAFSLVKEFSYSFAFFGLEAENVCLSVMVTNSEPLFEGSHRASFWGSPFMNFHIAQIECGSYHPLHASPVSF